MSTHAQINPDTPQIPSDISPRLKRKLDKELQAKERRASKRAKLTGRKPNFTKNISKNTAADLFRTLSVKEQCLQLLQSNDLRLRFEVIRYLWDRLEGKPFTAVNPAEAKQVATVNNDNRLQNAIINLIPGGAPKPKKKAKLLVAESEVVSESGINPVSQS